MKTKAPRPRDAEATKRALLAAARDAFVDDGYEGTDTNRIARAAGFAPQTFYRYFADKRAIFLAVYRAWVADGVGTVLGARSPQAAARKLIDEHATMRIFRRSLRTLSVVDEEVRRVRAAERFEQLEKLRATQPARFADMNDATLTAWLLGVERWADALVDGELEEMGISRPAATKELVRMLTSNGAGCGGK